MPIPGIGSAHSSYPSLPPTKGVVAFSFVALCNLSDIAGSLATQAASKAAAAKGPTSQLYAEMQALADLAKIHTYLNMSPPDITDALAAANDFLKLKTQCNMSDPNISAVYSQVMSYFTIDSKTGAVTSFKNDVAGNSFNTWWTLGSSASSGIAGAQYEFDWLGSLKNQSPQLWPSVNPNGYTPGVLVDLCLMYADAMSVPSIAKNNIDDLFWGNRSLGGPFSFADLLPYAMAAYAYQMTFIDSTGDKNWTTFNTMMSQMQKLLSSVIPSPGVSTTNYTQMLQEFKQLSNQISTTQAWPPTSPTAQITSSEWQILQATLSATDLSTFYGVVLDSMFGAFEYGN